MTCPTCGKEHGDSPRLVDAGQLAEMFGLSRAFFHDFSYKAASWKKPRRVIAKVEWHAGELFPRIGFIVTNMSAKAKNIVRFYNKRASPSCPGRS